MLLKTSSYLAISIYGVMALVAAVAAVCLPIETKGRELKVRIYAYRIMPSETVVALFVGQNILELKKKKKKRRRR